MFIMALNLKTGETLHNIGPYPRKYLMDRYGTKHAEKVYVDTRDGKSNHVGYIVRGEWWQLYTVTPWSK